MEIFKCCCTIQKTEDLFPRGKQSSKYESQKAHNPIEKKIKYREEIKEKAKTFEKMFNFIHQ